MQDVFSVIALHSLSLTGLNLNIQLRNIFTLYFPIIKTNYLIGCFDTPYFLLKRPSISLHTSSVGK